MKAAPAAHVGVAVRTSSRSTFVRRLENSTRRSGGSTIGAALKRFGNDIRGLNESHNGECDSKEKAKPTKGHAQSGRWALATCASFFPWVHATSFSAKASEVLDTAATAASTLEADFEAVDIRSLLAGDIAMLLAAPLVVYAALRLIFWESQEDAEASEEEQPLNPMLSANVHSVVKASPSGSASSYVSQLTDPELQVLAGKTAENIITSVRDAKTTCAFKLSLHDLAVKHGGAQDGIRWILDVVENSPKDVKEETSMEADRLASQNLSKKDLCRMLTRSIAQRVAMREVDALVQELQRHERNKASGRLFQ